MIKTKLELNFLQVGHFLFDLPYNIFKCESVCACELQAHWGKNMGSKGGHDVLQGFYTGGRAMYFVVFHLFFLLTYYRVVFLLF